MPRGPREAHLEMLCSDALGLKFHCGSLFCAKHERKAGRKEGPPRMKDYFEKVQHDSTTQK